MEDINKYIINNYHLISEKTLDRYNIDFEKLGDGIFEFAFTWAVERFAKTEMPKLIFINSIERKSKYIVKEDRHYILLDLHQIVECAWALKIARLIDEDIIFAVCGSEMINREPNIKMSLFSYASETNLLRAQISTIYNLADLCFSKGYVDAAVKNMHIIEVMKEGVDSRYGIMGEYSGTVFELSECVAIFVLFHEFIHYRVKRNKNGVDRIKQYQKLLDLIRIRYESGALGKAWRKHAEQISTDNYIENEKIEKLFAEMKIKERYPGLLEQLKENYLSWKDMTFSMDDWDLYTEELICDVEAINAMCSLWAENGGENYYFISHIIQALLIQETFSVQEDMLMYVTGKRNSFCLRNIKRAQLLFATLIVDYQERSNNREWEPVLNGLNFGKVIFTDLVLDICNLVEVIHENFYLVAVKVFCKSLLSEEVLRKDIRCTYYVKDGCKDFLFTDDYNGERQRYTGKNISGFEALFLQQPLTYEYNKFVRYILE